MDAGSKMFVIAGAGGALVAALWGLFKLSAWFRRKNEPDSWISEVEPKENQHDEE